MRDPMRVPVKELTNDELAAVHLCVNKVCGQSTHFLNVDLSDSEHEKAEGLAQKDQDRRALLNFVEGQTLVAGFIRSLTQDRGSVGDDELIGFIAEGGLEKNAMAAMIALREYERFVTGGNEIVPANVVDHLLQFYPILSRALRAAGEEWRYAA